MVRRIPGPAFPEGERNGLHPGGPRGTRACSVPRTETNLHSGQGPSRRRVFPFAVRRGKCARPRIGTTGYVGKIRSAVGVTRAPLARRFDSGSSDATLLRDRPERPESPRGKRDRSRIQEACREGRDDRRRRLTLNRIGEGYYARWVVSRSRKTRAPSAPASLVGAGLSDAQRRVPELLPDCACSREVGSDAGRRRKPTPIDMIEGAKTYAGSGELPEARGTDALDSS